MNVAKFTEENYPVNDIEKLILKTQPPYTNQQRAKLQKDILGHKLELEMGANEEMSDQEWQNACERVTEASDEELDVMWEFCAEWILSRRDVPLEDNDPVAQAIRDTIEAEDTYISESGLAVSHPTLIHQRYKRFTESLSPDYGFLPSVYHTIKNIPNTTENTDNQTSPVY